ncbi:hypothetical protein P879_01365 [Paragonimus westermani]|uniref:EF-hand domain-containing protein n=1 Tax=Paragonimus westermani TaxID=34504 RepID=A0A8T0DWV4_9TREM|nr:hypothetical protein P879_01365 [Paragonimus westermani]
MLRARPNADYHLVSLVGVFIWLSREYLFTGASANVSSSSCVLFAADLHHTDAVRRMPTKAEVQQILSVLDTNKDGKVSVDELKAFLDTADCKLDKKQVQQIIDTHDQDELAVCLSQ